MKTTTLALTLTLLLLTACDSTPAPACQPTLEQQWFSIGEGQVMYWVCTGDCQCRRPTNA